MMTVMAGATIAPALPEMTRAFADNPNAETLVKLVLTIPGLFIAITAPFSGWIIDRFGRIKLLLVMLFIYAVAGTSGLYLDNLIQVIIGRAFLGIAVGGIMTTAIALIGDYFEGEERKKFLGIQAGIMALSGTVFITSGGLLADIGWRYPFLVYGMALLIVPLVMIYLHEPGRLPKKNVPREDNASIPPVVWIVYALSFLGMAVFYMMPVQVPFLIQQISGVGNAATGIALGTTTFMGGLASFRYPWLKRRFTHYQLYGITFSIIGLGFLFISLAESYGTLYPGLVIAGLGAGLIMPNSNLCLVTISSPSTRGRILGGLTTFIFLGQFASPLMFQPIVSMTSIKKGFLYLSIVLIVFAVISLVRNRRLVQ